jgi:hypothetical protein
LELSLNIIFSILIAWPELKRIPKTSGTHVADLRASALTSIEVQAKNLACKGCGAVTEKTYLQLLRSWYGELFQGITSNMHTCMHT